MAKKKISIQSELKEIVNEMIEEYSRWDDIKKNGCSDPFWSDGCNINLVRNHIIYSKNEIRDFCTKNNLELPSEYFKSIPVEMPNDFMATPDKIKKDADKAYKIYCSTNLFGKLENITRDLKKEFKATALHFFGYKIGCKLAIKNGNLVEMRRYNSGRAKDDIKRAQELIKRNDIYKENEQLSLF